MICSLFTKYLRASLYWPYVIKPCAFGHERSSQAERLFAAYLCPSVVI